MNLKGLRYPLRGGANVTAGSGNGERMKENEQKTGKTPCIFKN